MYNIFNAQKKFKTDHNRPVVCGGHNLTHLKQQDYLSYVKFTNPFYSAFFCVSCQTKCVS